ncbi:MAG TPA: Ig-like domain-containing protein [Planctomycetota bacterium]
MLRPSQWRRVGLAACLAALASCSGSSRPDPGPTGVPGMLFEKPGGGHFLSDPHQAGRASRVRLLEVAYGRLVDVHDVDEQGTPSVLPVLRDVAIGEHVLSNGAGLVLETSPITGRTRLVVERPRAAPDEGQGTFVTLLAEATRALGPVVPRGGSGVQPVSLVPRNAVLVLRFDDLLEDGPEAREGLRALVRLVGGYPPDVPLPARVVFDPSHGGIAEGAFHSTRVLVDFTVSEEEALELPYFVPVNPAGVPPSSERSPLASAAVHLPTELDPTRGRFARLTNLAGRGLLVEGPVDPATGDLVRAFRAGNGSDASAGFLLDLAAPRLIGEWDAALDAARDDPDGPAGLGFEVTLRFRTLCRAAPLVGDVVEAGGELYEVRAPGAAPDPGGRVEGLRLLRLAREPLADPALLVGLARLRTPYRDLSAFPLSCWVGFVPPPRFPPHDGVPPDARLTVRFSEPMAAETFRAFDTLRILRGATLGSEVQAGDLVVGAVEADPSLLEFRLAPRLPLANVLSLQYFAELSAGPTGVRDLSGNPLERGFGRVEFFLDGSAAPERNGGFGLRFDGLDELDPPGLADLRGQVSYEGGVLRPRPPLVRSFTVDRFSTLQSTMTPYRFGVQTPLSSLGSKMQAVWRYCDFGFRVRDETYYNLDVIGLSWVPLDGRLLGDFFPLFELRLAHSRHLPDESGNSNSGPLHAASGLPPGPALFEDNVLDDPRGPQVAVHPRGLGYQVRPTDLFVTSRGTTLLPFPWNRTSAPLVSWTWRDTAILAEGGATSTGVPLDVEVGPPHFLDEGVASFALPGEVPSVGLPLLWEVRCFPSSQSLGFNSFEILLPIPGFNTPNFRCFSTGGVDQSGQVVRVEPDLEPFPQGGFNPRSVPPGRRTPLSADNSFYTGQIDTVVRISRAVTVWIGSRSFTPRWVEPVLEPRQQLAGSAIELEFRGARRFAEEAGNAPFDASALDPYGDLPDGQVEFHGDGTWSAQLSSIDGAPFVQVRFTFVNDVEGQITPVLDSFGLAFEER